MSLLDIAAQSGPTGQSLIVPPSTPTERFYADYDAAMAPDRWSNFTGARREGWQQSIDALHASTGQAFANPYGAMTAEEMTRLGNQPAVIDERRQKIITAHRTLMRDSGVSADLPDPEMIDQRIGDQSRAVRDRAAGLIGTGNGMAAFAAGMVAPTPENLIGLMIPPSKLVLGATTVGRGFLAGLGREALYQGAAMGALTTASEGLDTLSRGETGTAPTLGEAIGNIAMGAAAGGVLGAGFHTLHAGPKAIWEHWNRLPETVRDNAPLEVRDAMKTLGTEALYADANRLGLPWATHERYLGEALDAVSRGRPVDLAGLTPGDMPMTALGTILRAAPDRINVEGVQREAGRVAMLPDSELAPIARELKPQSFAALDTVEAKIKALDERAEAIHREADQIGVADVADPDTAAILRDIEERLKQPALRRAEREQLLHERAQWIESLDVHGGLTEDLRAGRRDVFPEHRAQLEEIAAEREKLTREHALAAGEAKREVDFLRSKLDRIETGKPHTPEEPGYTPPADVAKALEAAEFNRQIRMVRESMAPGDRPVVSRETAKGTPAAPAEQAQAIEAAANAVMEGKGTLGDFKRVAARELEALDLELKDAKAASACVANGGGIP